jgi:hypothetical protein
MVQVVIFTGLVCAQTYTVRGVVKHEPATLERDINEFLTDNPDIKLVDIKYFATMVREHDCFVGTALVIYKEPDTVELTSNAGDTDGSKPGRE